MVMLTEVTERTWWVLTKKSLPFVGTFVSWNGKRLPLTGSVGLDGGWVCFVTGEREGEDSLGVRS